MPRIPAINQVRVETGTQMPEYPDEHERKRYMILYPEDYQGHGIDVAGNVALLVDKDNATEIKRLAEEIIDSIEQEEQGECINACPACGALEESIEEHGDHYVCTRCGCTLDKTEDDND